MQEILILGISNRRFIILRDNSTIQKLNRIKNFLGESNLLMVTIPSYLLAFNVAEKFILPIKKDEKV